MRKRWDAIIDRMPKDAPIVGVELGVYKAETSEKLLEALPMLTLYMVDRWKKYSDKERKAIAESEKKVKDGIKGTIPKSSQDKLDKIKKLAHERVKVYGDRAKIVISDTVEAASIIEGLVDFVFIDAGHDYESVCRDIEAWKDKVKPGGWILGHDYDERHFGLRKAVDEYFPNIEKDDDAVWGVRC